MAFGLSPEGFTIKRLADLKADDDALADELFLPLVSPGDIVDKSASSTIGRLIGLHIDPLSDLWEIAQQVYLAFDPNSAMGVALDNLVAYGGLIRGEQTFSTAQALFTGDVGTLIDAGLTVRGTTTGEDFTVRASVAINATGASGIAVQAITVADSTLYTITYIGATTTNTISYTSGVGSTQTSIQAGIKAVVDASHPTLTATITNNILYIDRVSVFDTVNFTSSANIGIVKARKVGSLTAVNAGPIEGEANTITSIQTPKTGWDAVTNPTAVVPGEDVETDEELRERFRQSKYIRATNILEALYSDLISLENVIEVQIYENDTDVVDANGVPAHSFLPIILGGDPLDIAETIWENKPLGIRSYGNTTQTIYDSQGFPHEIGFERPNPVDIYIRMDLTTNANYPQNGDDLIRSNLASYFTSDFGIGDDVIYSRLYTPINSVPGHAVNSLEVSTDGVTWTTANIDVPFNGIATLESNNIVITKT
jgi:uncharacterized phage protein gp47/JayE